MPGLGDECDDSRAPAPASREGLLTFRMAIERERNKRQIGPAHEVDYPRIYVAGPVTGLPNENRPAFTAAELQLRGLAFAVVNPLTLPHRHDKTWASYMRECIPAMLTCESVALLPGWQLSRGAIAERDIALMLGMDVRPLADWLLPMASQPRPAQACTSGQAGVGADSHSVRPTSYDVAPGECVMCFERDPKQQRKCAELHPGVCDVRPLPGAADSEGGEL